MRGALARGYAQVAGSHRVQSLRARLSRPVLRARVNRNRDLHFYFLSTGRVGTRFFSTVLGTATNARVLHQPEPQLRETAVAEAVRLFCADRGAFERLRVQDFPRLHAKLLRQQGFPEAVYGDTLNHMFPFGLMLHRYLGERVRLIHLIRHPVDCGRSILTAERRGAGSRGRMAELRPREFLGGASEAEQVASIWNGINGMITAQFEQIDDDRICRVVRLEDRSVEQVRGLFDFLHLDGFDPDVVTSLMGDDSHAIRHSHVNHPDNRDRGARADELALIDELCGPLARRFGYRTKTEPGATGAAPGAGHHAE